MQERIEEIVKSACAEHNVALYDLEFKPTGHGRILLVYITSLGGVKVQDCQRVSRRIENALEEEDLIEGRYFLEVSSPGLERDLKKKRHFVSAINENVKLTVQGDEVNERLKGRLLEVNPNSIKISVEKDETREIELSRIKKAKTLYDPANDLKRNKAEKKEKQ